MHIDNRIDNDNVRVSEIQDFLGKGNSPSTRPPFQIPIGIKTRRASRRHHYSDQRHIKRYDQRPLSDIDMGYKRRATDETRERLLLEEYFVNVYNSADGSHNPENAMIDALDEPASVLRDEPADITRAWKEREQELRMSDAWLHDSEPLHDRRERLVIRGGSKRLQKKLLAEYKRVKIRLQNRNLTDAEMWDIAQYRCDGRYTADVHSVYVDVRLPALLPDSEERWETSVVEDEHRERRLKHRERGRIDYSRQTQRDKGLPSLRSMQFAIADKIAEEEYLFDLEYEAQCAPYEAQYEREVEDLIQEAACEKFEDAEFDRQFEHALAHEASDAYSPPYNSFFDWLDAISGMTAA